MAVSAKTVPSNLATSRSGDPSADNTVQYPVVGAGNILGIYIDNTGNGVPTYVKFYDDVDPGVTVGTTVPEHIIMCPASVARMVTIPEGIAFATGLGYAAVAEPGTPGTTSPAVAVPLRLLTD
jgi:hypothetical protein